MDPKVTIIEGLNSIGAGTFILIVIFLISAIVALIVRGIKIKKAYDDIQRKKVIKELDEEHEAEDVNDVINKVNELENKIDANNESLKQYVDEKYDLLETRVEATEKLTQNLSDSLIESRNSLNGISESLQTISNSINILIDSDCQTIESFIMAEYNKWVEEKKEIDLISLQNIEKMYKKYLEEVGDEEGDKFIEKLMQELRNLPTKK